MDNTGEALTLDQALGQVISMHRRIKGISVDELARRSGISPSTIIRLEKGLRNAGVDYLVSLGKVFGTTGSKLLAKAEGLFHQAPGGAGLVANVAVGGAVSSARSAASIAAASRNSA